MDVETFEEEARPLIPGLSPFYDWTRGVSWLLIRATLGGLSLFHVWPKLTGTFPITRPAAILARLGIEPAVLFSYLIFGIELFGGICLILGLFTRFWAAATAIELAVITFGVYWPNGFAWNVANGGAELPFLWGMMVFAVALRGGGPYSLDRKLGVEL